jgi:hypothetical protein
MGTRLEVTVDYPRAAYVDLTIEDSDEFKLTGTRLIDGVATAFEDDVVGKLRIRPTDPPYTTILYEADIDFGTPSTAGGVFTITIPSDDTTGIVWAEGVYEAYFTQTEGGVVVTHRLLEGTVVVKRTQGADAP